MTEVLEVVDSYAAIIARSFGAHVESFGNRRRANPEAARAEAVAYFVLKGACHHVQILESPSSGGPDFICRSADNSFVVEVTAVEAATAERRSGLQSDLPCGSFGFLTDVIKSKLRAKAPVVASAPAARLLFVYCEHSAGPVLVGPDAAERMLSGDFGIALPIMDEPGEPHLSTALQESAFFRMRLGKIEACRQSISGVLLAHGSAAACGLVGVLHPAPAVPFDIDLMPDVPFCKLKQWPVSDAGLETTWVIGRPRPRVYDLSVLASIYGEAEPI